MVQSVWDYLLFRARASQRFLLLDRLPRNEAGKVLKRELAALGLARQRN